MSDSSSIQADRAGTREGGGHDRAGHPTGRAGPRAGGAGTIAHVTLYTSPGCHLCDEARSALQRVRADHRFELLERDITLDDDLHRAYLERIPVVALNGEELFEYFVQEDLLRARLASLH